MFKVFKDSDNNIWWIGITSTAYQDRDGEIVSRQALNDDVQKRGFVADHGVLRWGHIGKPNVSEMEAGVGLDIGDCKFAMVSGKCLIEAGTFRNQAQAKIIAEHANEFEMSIGFWYADDEKKDGVYKGIYRFERSLIHKNFGRASNLFTNFATFQEVKKVMDIKKATLDFLGLFSGNQEAAKAALEQAQTAAKEIEQVADALGVASKSEKPQENLTLEQVKQALNVDGLATVIKSLQENAKQSQEQNEALAAKVKELEEQIKQLKLSEDQKIAAAITPEPMSWNFAGGFVASKNEQTLLTESEADAKLKSLAPASQDWSFA